MLIILKYRAVHLIISQLMESCFLELFTDLWLSAFMQLAFIFFFTPKFNHIAREKVYG